MNWVIAKIGARAIRAPRFHLFDVLGQHKLLFLSFLPYSAMLLNWGKLSRKDAEVVILRVGHLRNCEYELQQHRRLARSRGLDKALQESIFEGPHADGLSDRQRLLLEAVDELMLNREIGEQTWSDLTDYFNHQQLIELCLLTGHYDSLAATIASIRLPLDFPD
ncbi:MAG: carboxymuconolactone decarboxylase family protein [Mycobacterium sp.]